MNDSPLTANRKENNVLTLVSARNSRRNKLHHEKKKPERKWQGWVGGGGAFSVF